MSELETRIRKKKLLSRVMKPEDTVKLFEEAGAGKKVLNLGWSGFTPVGLSKSSTYSLS